MTTVARALSGWSSTRLLPLFFGGWLWGTLAWAEPPVPAQGTVTKVVVDGNRRIEEAVVLAAVSLRRGEPVDEDKIRRDLKAVYGTGFFEDVQVDLVQDPTGP